MFSYGDIDWNVFLLALDGEVDVNESSLVLAGVREERQSSGFSVDGCALQQIKGSSNEIVRFLIISEKKNKKKNRLTTES